MTFSSVSSRPVQRVVLAASASVLALGLAACGSSDSPTAGGSTTSATSTPAATTSAATPAATPVETPAATPAEEPAGGAADGAAVIKAMNAKMAEKKYAGVSGSMAGVAFTGSFIFDDKGAARTHLKMGPIESIVIGAATYTKMNGKWTKSATPDMGAMAASGVVSETVLDSLKKVGEAKVNGEKVTHYQSKLTLADLTKLATKDQAEQYNLLKQAGMTAQVSDVYLADSGLPVQVKSTLVGLPAKQGVSEFTYSDWGKAVTIEAPTVG